MNTLMAVLLSSWAVWAQAPAPVASAPSTAQLPEITFTFDNPNLNPVHYELTVDAQGRAKYRSHSSEEFPPVIGDVEKEFDVSPATRERIFGLAKEANYFDGDFEFRKHRIAYTGDRVLTYKEGAINHSTRFGWSENAAVQALSSLLEGISTTLEAEPRLRHLRRYDRLGLNDQLAKLERMAQGGWLREPQLLAPVLKELAGDSSVMNIARQRAQRLLALAESQNPSSRDR